MLDKLTADMKKSSDTMKFESPCQFDKTGSIT